MIPRLVAATGAVLLWAYARACHRTATQRRLARANLLRRVSARPEKIKVHVREVRAPEGVPQWMAEVHDVCLTEEQAAIVKKYFTDPGLSIEPGDVEIPVRRSAR